MTSKTRDRVIKDVYDLVCDKIHQNVRQILMDRVYFNSRFYYSYASKEMATGIFIEIGYAVTIGVLDNEK